MTKANWKNRKKVLSKNEMDHLNKVAGCKTKAQFQNCINIQAQWRADNPTAMEPCWDCRLIAAKLNMVPFGFIKTP